MRALWLLAAVSRAAQDFHLMPPRFTVSPGERVTIEVHGVGVPGRVKDATLYAASGAYNLTNLRLDGATVLVDGTAKGPGTIILGAKAGDEFAKSLVTSGEPSEFYRHRIGHLLEIVPESLPSVFTVWYRGKPAAGVEVDLVSAAGELKSAGRTDGAGHIRIRIEGFGVYRLRAASENARASLVFEAP